MKRASLTVFGWLLIVAQASAEGMSDAQKAKVRTAVEAEVQKMVAAANAANIDLAMASSSASSDYRFADNGTVYGSAEALLTVYREAFGRLRQQDVRLIEQHTQVLAPDLAMYTARGTFTSTDKSGATTPATPFAWTMLWKRESGSWKQMNAHQSFGRPAAP